MPSSTFWMRSPISTPRQLTQVISGDEHDAGDRDERHVVGEERVLGAAHDAVDERPEVDAGDLREVREHDHAGDGDAPAAHPAHPRAERLRPPRERGAAVGDRVVELAVGERDEEHRDEGDDERDGRLRADGEHDEAERRDERVDGCGGGEPDDGRAPQSERAGCESLSFGSGQVYRGCSHTVKLWPSSRAVKDIGGTDRPDVGAGQDDAHGLGTRRDRARPGRARARSTGGSDARAGQQPQLGRARRVDDEVVVGADLGEHAPVPLPVVRLAGQHERARPRSCSGSAAYSSSVATRMPRSRPRRERRARGGRAARDESGQAAVGDHARAAATAPAPARTARAPPAPTTPSNVPRPGARRARSARGRRPRRSDPPATRSAARSGAAAARRAAPWRRSSRWAEATTRIPDSPAPRSTRSSRSSELVGVVVRQAGRERVEVVDEHHGARRGRMLDELGDGIPRSFRRRRAPGRPPPAPAPRRPRARSTCPSPDRPPRAGRDPRSARPTGRCRCRSGSSARPSTSTPLSAWPSRSSSSAIRVGQRRQPRPPRRRARPPAATTALDVGRLRQRDAHAARRCASPPRRRSARPRPPASPGRFAASSVPITARLSAASVTRRLIRSGQLASRLSRITPAARCVPRTRCTPSARPRAATSEKTACSSGWSPSSAANSSTTTTSRGRSTRGSRMSRAPAPAIAASRQRDLGAQALDRAPRARAVEIGDDARHVRHRRRARRTRCRP